MQILRHYPFSILTVLAIWYLSFFTPPHTQLEEINNFDKLVHVCMYGGLSSIIWIEYLIQHKQIKSFPLIMGSILFPILMSGCIEILQSCCTDNRSGDWIDFIANCTGVCLASLAGHYIYRPFIQKKYYCCPIKILRSYKIRADFICEVSPFSLDFSRQTIKSNHGQKYTF